MQRKDSQAKYHICQHPAGQARKPVMDGLLRGTEHVILDVALTVLTCTRGCGGLNWTLLRASLACPCLCLPYGIQGGVHALRNLDKRSVQQANNC